MKVNYLMRLAVSLALLAAGQGAWADRSFALMEQTASGQFDQVIATLAADGAERLPIMERHLLCHAYAMTKRYDNLFACLDQMEAELKATEDRETLLFALDDATPTVGLMRAQAYIELGRHEEAIALARAVIDWLHRLGEEEPVLVIDAHAILAVAGVFAGRPELARPLIPVIEKAGRSFLRDSYKDQRALALARVYMALQDYPRVVGLLSGGLGSGVGAFLDNLFSGAYMRGRDNWLWQELPRSYMLSRALLGMGDLERARSGYDRLLEIEAVRNNGEIYWMANFDRGQIAELLSDKAAAVSYYSRAIEALEVQRLSIHTEANKIGFIADKQAAYARIIRLLVELGRSEEAFEYLERSRSRALVDLLARKQDWRPRQASDRVQDLLRRQQEEDAKRLSQGGVVRDDGLWQAGGTSSVRELRRLDPAIAALVSVTTLPIATIRAALQGEDRLLEYFLDADTLFLFILSRTGLVVHQVAASGLSGQVAAFRQAIERRSPEVPVLAAALYDRLIRPLDLADDGARLIIVPHGPFHYLPFAALHDGQRYLIESRPISLLSSASVLEFMARGDPNRSIGGQALILGNPDLGSRRLNLPYAEKEAKQVANLLPEHDLLLRKEASEAAFRRLAGQRELIHLACHGEFLADQPLHSGLLMGAGDGQDGRLTVDEIYGLELSARLVTLSACETGLGKVASGDDVIGLTRGFVYAGAGNVLASLWKVDDVATAELMDRFYQARAVADDSEALRQAQQALIGKGAHPYYWAAFYLTGR